MEEKGQADIFTRLRHYLSTGQIVLLAMVVFVYTGCSVVGPDYVPPDMQLPDSWKTQLEGGLVYRDRSEKALERWWDTLDDATLSALVEAGLNSSLDMQTAYARIRESRARYGISRAGLFPALTSAFSQNITHTDLSDSSPTTRRSYSAGVDTSWELDLFGGNQRAVEASQADLDATEDELYSARLSLTSELALNYLNLRTAQRRLRIAEDNIRVQGQLLELVSWKVRAGTDDELSLEQARYSLESSRSQIPGLRVNIAESLNRMATLIDDPSHQVLNKLLPDNDVRFPKIPKETAIGIPADLIRERPDVRKAERQLAAQSARIGVAKADLYPKFQLLGSIGLEAVSLTHVSSENTKTLGESALVSWPIFRAGEISENIKVQEALHEQSLLEYKVTLLGAFEEVENALLSYAEEQHRKSSLQKAVDSANHALELARNKYSAGLSDYSDVLESQRAVSSLLDQLVESQGSEVANLVMLYKAMGGGLPVVNLPDCEQHNSEN